MGAGRKGLLTWLISAADSTKQVATTRAKAVKALACVAETDPRLLASSAVQKGVNKALQVCPQTFSFIYFHLFVFVSLFITVCYFVVYHLYKQYLFSS